MNLTSNYTRSADRNLIAEGYKLFPSQIRPELFSVVKPDLTVYTVDLVAGTCDCTAGKRGINCCHKRQAATEKRAAENPNRPAAGTEAYKKMVSADFD